MGHAKIAMESDAARVSFGMTGGGSWAEWDRHLLVDGKQAYHIGNICGTCAFFFEKGPHASRTFSGELSAPAISDRLRIATDLLEPSFLKRLGSILESGEYEVLHRRVDPVLTSPGADQDYFSNESIELFGVDGYYGVPHSTRTPYYRCPDLPISPSQRLFEFLVPLHQPGTLDPDRVAEYETLLNDGNTPTALSVSVLDVKAPVTVERPTDLVEHWCLAHYVLDGHHKIQAAAQLNAPIGLLSFLSVGASIADSDALATTIRVLTRHAT